MITADFNHEDFSNTSEADKNLMVKFFVKSVQNVMESGKQGRPVFKEKVYIEIRIAGQRDAQACRPVTHADKQRFPQHWKAYNDRTAPPTEGAPLSEWAMISRSQVDELAFSNVKTVEQLASISDTNLQSIMGGNILREKAIKWLATEDVEVVERERAKLAAEVAELRAMVAKLSEPTPAVSEEVEEEPAIKAPKRRKARNETV